tara:strand:+ start:449 stop:1798 length:1350 start_codon:yes stop_codon:yes gene_type:complete
MVSLKEIDKTLNDLFYICRSITGEGNIRTIEYLIKNIIKGGEIKSIKSGKHVFDWKVPPQWEIKDAYVKNKFGEKIINFKNNNLHVVSYSDPFKGKVTKKELLNHLHTLPNRPNAIPYRTSYYNKTWGFCCSQKLIKSESFVGPFDVCIDSCFKEDGVLNWFEYKKKGKSDKEILISTYLCHPSLANDNLSGLVMSSFLIKELNKIETYYSYRLLIVPETIGAICFLSESYSKKIIGGMIVTCVGGPGKLSIKEGFDSNHWINEAANLSLKSYTRGDYIKYPFTPDGSDERQYSTPSFKIVTPSIHKSKYYEYDEYHTSDDNLKFISSSNIQETLKVHIKWIKNIESFCYPERYMKSGEFQLGKRGLYPNLGGTINQLAYEENSNGFQSRVFNSEIVSSQHLEAFNWLMHLCDGEKSNFEISKISKIDIDVINESIQIFHKNNLIKINK